jgi:hypothetical protein
MTNADSNYDESKHNRDAAKRYAPKEQGAPQVAIRPPRKLGQLGGYEIKSYKALATGAFTATIWRDGKKVLSVSNDGRGGPNRYDRPFSTAKAAPETTEQMIATRNAATTEEKAFHDMAQKALGDGYAEQEDIFIDVILWNADIEKHAGRYGYTRDSVVEGEILRRESESPYPLTEEEKTLLRNPDWLDQS